MRVGFGALSLFQGRQTTYAKDKCLWRELAIVTMDHLVEPLLTVLLAP